MTDMLPSDLMGWLNLGVIGVSIVMAVIAYKINRDIEKEFEDE